MPANVQLHILTNNKTIPFDETLLKNRGDCQFINLTNTGVGRFDIGYELIVSLAHAPDLVGAYTNLQNNTSVWLPRGTEVEIVVPDAEVAVSELNEELDQGLPCITVINAQDKSQKFYGSVKVYLQEFPKEEAPPTPDWGNHSMDPVVLKELEEARIENQELIEALHFGTPLTKDAVSDAEEIDFIGKLPILPPPQQYAQASTRTSTNTPAVVPGVPVPAPRAPKVPAAVPVPMVPAPAPSVVKPIEPPQIKRSKLCTIL